MKIQEQLIQLIGDANRNAARELLEEWFKNNPSEIFFDELLLPVLEVVGKRYISKESLSLAQAYVASKFAADGFELFKKHSSSQPSAYKGHVVLANIEDDFHDLGRDIACNFLEADGWNVVNMGNDKTAEEIVDKAVETGARVIGVSAMMYTTALNIKEVRKELQGRGLENSIKIAVGGAIFAQRPTMVDEVDADGTCKSATEVSQLFEKLWELAKGGNNE
ncbi:MAG: corrinoid-binding protein [Desulfobacteraceae bacterium]|nr:corrinoid-binding protein [Desulfobacteraceae bacterium]